MCVLFYEALFVYKLGPTERLMGLTESQRHIADLSPEHHVTRTAVIGPTGSWSCTSIRCCS